MRGEVQLEQVEVYRTTVNSRQQADALERLLVQKFPEMSVHFDLDDCDRILRIASMEQIRSDEISTIGQRLEVQIEVLGE